MWRRIVVIEMTSARNAIKIGAAFFSLMVVWSLITPLFSGPDEPSNFIRSAAVVRGEWVGENYPASIQKSYWTTYVQIDPQFGTANAIPWCFVWLPANPGCGDAVEDAPVVDIPTWTNMGRYPPLPFVLSGIGTVFGATNLSVHMARIMTSFVCALLIAYSAYAILRRKQSLLGLLVALTPGTIFLASAMNPSAIEICSAIALWSILPSVHQGQVNDRIIQQAFIVAGVLLIATRPIGIAMYVVISVISWLAFGSMKFFLIIKANKVALSLHLLTATFMAWWYVAVYSYQTSPSLTVGTEKVSITTQITQSMSHIPELLDNFVGNFGWLDTPIPRGALWLYVFSVSVFVINALSQLGKRSAQVLVLLSMTVICIAIAIDLNFYAMFGWFGAQGRHIAPILVGVPLLIAIQSSFGNRLQIAIVTGWTVTMVWAGLGALRRYTVGINGSHAFSMLANRTWNPASGFWISVLLLVAASVLVATTVLSSRRALADQ
jgi:hypothetical protein